MNNGPLNTYIHLVTSVDLSNINPNASISTCPFNYDHGSLSETYNTTNNELENSIQLIQNEIAKRNTLGYGMGAVLSSLLAPTNTIAPQARSNSQTSSSFSMIRTLSGWFSSLRTWHLGNTAVHTAIENNDRQQLEALIANNANWNLANKEGLTPLDLASNLGNIELAKVLLIKGADIYPQGYLNKLLHKAINKEDIAMTELLLSHGACANRINTSLPSVSPLERAVYRKNEALVDVLLSYGACPFGKDWYDEFLFLKVLDNTRLTEVFLKHIKVIPKEIAPYIIRYIERRVEHFKNAHSNIDYANAIATLWLKLIQKGLPCSHQTSIINPLIFAAEYGLFDFEFTLLGLPTLDGNQKDFKRALSNAHSHDMIDLLINHGAGKESKIIAVLNNYAPKHVNEVAVSNLFGDDIFGVAFYYLPKGIDEAEAEREIWKFLSFSNSPLDSNQIGAILNSPIKAVQQIKNHAKRIFEQCDGIVIVGRFGNGILNNIFISSLLEFQQKAEYKPLIAMGYGTTIIHHFHGSLLKYFHHDSKIHLTVKTHEGLLGSISPETFRASWPSDYAVESLGDKLEGVAEDEYGLIKAIQAKDIGYPIIGLQFDNLTEEPARSIIHRFVDMVDAAKKNTCLAIAQNKGEPSVQEGKPLRCI